MIALAIVVAGISSVFVSSLAFANAIHKRMLEDERWEPPVPPTRASVAEKRRILERDRAEWLRGTGGEHEIQKLDRQLLALADEEARCID